VRGDQEKGEANPMLAASDRHSSSSGTSSSGVEWSTAEEAECAGVDEKRRKAKPMLAARDRKNLVWGLARAERDSVRSSVLHAWIDGS